MDPCVAMKKFICFLLSCIMFFSCFPFTAGAETNPTGIGVQWDKDLTIQFADGDKYPYTGKPVTPKFIIRDKAGKILAEGTDYRVEYWNNTDPGTAVAYIFPSGNPASAYGGTGYSTMMFYITGQKPDEFTMPDFDSFKLPEVDELEVPDWVGKNDLTLPDKGTGSTSAGESKAQSTSVGKTKLPKAVITKLTANGSRKIKIKWKKCSKITGYQIQYSTSKKFKKNVRSKTAGKKKTSITISGLKKTTYYVRIRTYKKANGKTSYGKRSSVKKIKIKK